MAFPRLGLTPGVAWLECGYDDNRRLSGRAPVTVTVLDPAAQEGYVAAATRIYVLRQRGRPWATASVQRDGDAFAAMLDKRCHPPVDPGR